jgi:hypothetical protein
LIPIPLIQHSTILGGSTGEKKRQTEQEVDKDLVIVKWEWLGIKLKFLTIVPDVSSERCCPAMRGRVHGIIGCSQ